MLAPMELGHLPFRKATFEDYVGEAARERHGHDALGEGRPRDDRDGSRRRSCPSTSCSAEATRAMLGELPSNCRLGHNEDAFLGGFRLWVED